MSVLIFAVVTILVLATAYVRWTLRRVRRLHRRVRGAETALVSKLDARAEAALGLIEVPGCDEVAWIAKTVAGSSVRTVGERESRQYRENDLTRALGDLLPSLTEERRHAINAANRRVSLAQQLHTDVVRDALVAGEKPVAIMFGVPRRYGRPEYWDLADPTVSATSDLALLN